MEGNTQQSSSQQQQQQQQQHSQQQVRKAPDPSGSMAFVMMEDIIEKLKLLNYEKKFKPISRLYFAIPHKQNPAEQFHTFVEMVSWLMLEKIQISDFQPPDPYDDPNTTSNNIVMELKSRLGLSFNFIPQKLRTGCGDAACEVLNKLLDKALGNSDFKFGDTVIPQAMIFNEMENVYEDDGDLDDSGDIQEIEVEEDEEEFHTEKKAPELIETNVSAADWKLEMEQVSSQLVLRLNEDHKDWRTHVESMSEQKESIQGQFADTTANLQRISEEIGKISERIQKREKMLQGDSSISLLLDQYKKGQEELDIITKKHKEYEENISNLSSELSKVSQELEETKSTVDELGKKMEDSKPLEEIRKAIQRLKTEVQQMDLQIGVLQHTVLQYKIKKSRKVASATSSSLGFSSNHLEYDTLFENEDDDDEDDEYD